MQLVRTVRHKVRQGNLVPTLAWWPEGVLKIERTERVEMEHGDSSMTYTLTCVWTFEPTHGVRCSIRIQTNPVPEVCPQPEAQGPVRERRGM